MENLQNSLGKCNPANQWIDDYEKVKLIGGGTFGKVYLVKPKEKAETSYFACKTIDLSLNSSDQRQIALRETVFLSTCSHPNILKLKNVYMSVNRVILLMDYYQMNLFEYYNNYEIDLQGNTVKKLFKGLLSAVNYLHSNRVMHRDVKPQNVLLNIKDNEIDLRLSDFGLSRKFHIPLRKYTKNVLTRGYAALEMLAETDFYGPSVDIWSLGILFLEIVLKRHPFKLGSSSEIDLIKSIGNLVGFDDLTYIHNVLGLKVEKTEGSLNELLDKCGVKEDLASLIKNMLVIDPLKRISAKDALKSAFFNDI